MNRIFLSLGSNLGERKENLKKGGALLEELAGTIMAESAVYETEPWGFCSDMNFYNQAISLLSDISPQQLLHTIHEIERHCGRKPASEKNAPRTLDIDILFFNDEIINTPELVLPHPSLHLRRFVLVPLAEIAPQLVHPLLKMKIGEVLHFCKDDKKVIQKL
jgi:2-amino-4-hydroxy-6-hydroxymethyldihydropteridine diphosphokinase